MKFFENVKMRNKIIVSSFFRNKDLIAEKIFKIIFYICISYNLFVLSVMSTYEKLSPPYIWLIVTAVTSIPIIILGFEIAYTIRKHLDSFDKNPSIIISDNLFVYRFYKTRKSGEVIEVKYKAKLGLIENVYVDETKSAMFIKAPFDITNGDDVVMARDDALFIPLVFHETDKLLFFIEGITHRRIELLK